MRLIFLVTVAIMFLASSDFKIDINKTLINVKDYDYKDSGFGLDYVFKIFKSKKYLNDKYKKKSKVIKLSKNYSNIVEFIKSEEFYKNYKNIFRVDKCVKKIDITGIIYDKKSAMVEIDGVNSGNVFTYFIIYLKNKKLYSYFIECEVVNEAPVDPISPIIELLNHNIDVNISVEDNIKKLKNLNKYIKLYKEICFEDLKKSTLYDLNISKEIVNLIKIDTIKYIKKNRCKKRYKDMIYKAYESQR